MSEEHQAATQPDSAALLAELEATRARAAAEERRANALEAQVVDGSRRLAGAQVAQLTQQEQTAKTAITTLDDEIKSLKRQQVALFQEGKFEEASDIGERIGEAAAKRENAKTAASYYETQRTQAAAAPADPVEAWIAARQGQYSTEDQNWIRQHRRYALDSDFQNRVVQAHTEATEKLNLTRGTPEYYAHLEKRGYMRPDPAPKPPTDTQASTDQPAGDAPSGYTGEEVADEGPEIVIQEARVAAADQRPENPQPRAAGAGSMRAAIAASPSHRSPMSPSGRVIKVQMTQEEKETALANAPHFAPDDVLKGGEKAVLLWWDELKNSSAAKRIQENWKAGV